MVGSAPGVEQVWSAEVDGGDGLLAIVVRRHFTAEGVTFFTDSQAPQQVANIRHPAGHVIPAHIHHPRTRQTTVTTEVLVVRSGVVSVQFYTSAGRPVDSKELRGGDVCVLLGGGHGMRMDTDAEFWEVKSGPYFGKDLDKRML